MKTRRTQKMRVREQRPVTAIAKIPQGALAKAETSFRAVVATLASSSPDQVVLAFRPGTYKVLVGAIAKGVITADEVVECLGLVTEHKTSVTHIISSMTKLGLSCAEIGSLLEAQKDVFDVFREEDPKYHTRMAQIKGHVSLATLQKVGAAFLGGEYKDVGSVVLSIYDGINDIDDDERCHPVETVSSAVKQLLAFATERDVHDVGQALCMWHGEQGPFAYEEGSEDPAYYRRVVEGEVPGGGED